MRAGSSPDGLSATLLGDEGATGCVVVTGPKGIGRTSVLAATAESVGARRFAGLATVADVRHLTLSRLCRTDLADADRAGALDVVAAVVSGVLVVDDAQDVDPDSLAVLVALGERRRVLLGWRDDVVPSEALDGVVRVGVEPLDVASAEELARAHGATDPAAVARRSGGIPGLVLACARGGDLTPYLHAIDRVLDRLSDEALRSLWMLDLADDESLDPTLLGSVDELVASGLVACHDDESLRVVGVASALARERAGEDELRATRRRLVAGAASPVTVATQRLALGDEAEAIAGARLAASAATSSPRTKARLTALIADRTGDPADHLAAATAAVRFTDGASALAHAARADAPDAALRRAQGLRLTGDLLAARVIVARPADEEAVAERDQLDARVAFTGPMVARPPTVADEHDPDGHTTALVASLLEVFADGEPALADAFERLVALGRSTGAPLPASVAGLSPAVGFHLGQVGTEVADALTAVDGPVAALHVVLGLAHAGRTGDATTVLDADRWPATPVWASIRSWLRAEVALLGGRLVSCRNAAEAAADGVPTDFPGVDLARLAATRAAVEAGDELAVWTPQSVLAPTIARELDALASADADRFDDAAAAWTGRHHPAALRCRLDAARRRLPDPAAIGAVEELAREAEHLGFRVLHAEARRSLRRSGVRTATTGGVGAGALSPREREVLTHVAAGASSREIGNLLGVAASTVDTQVKSAMQKLGARTRLQAATMAAELER